MIFSAGFFIRNSTCDDLNFIIKYLCEFHLRSCKPCVESKRKLNGWLFHTFSTSAHVLPHTSTIMMHMIIQFSWNFYFNILRSLSLSVGSRSCFSNLFFRLFLTFLFLRKQITKTVCWPKVRFVANSHFIAFMWYFDVFSLCFVFASL